MASAPSPLAVTPPTGAAPRGPWLTPTSIALMAMVALCVILLGLRVVGARSQAQNEGAAAMALTAQWPAASEGDAAAQAALQKSVDAAMQPLAAVLSVNHCFGTQCTRLYSRADAPVCDEASGFSLTEMCLAVRSAAQPGYVLNLRYDLRPMWQSALLDMAAAVLISTFVLMLWRAATQALRDSQSASGQQTRQAAEHDALTGLLTRVAFETALKRHNEAKAAPSGSTDGCLMYFDLDRFKIINDTHGHIAGDMVLKTVAQRLRYTLGSDVLIGRLGGDEFAVLLVDVSTPATIEQMGRVVIEQVSKPIQMEGVTDYVGLSIGAFMLTRGELSVGEMLHRADLAMYEAKRAGRGRLVFFDQSMDESARCKAQVQADLKKALQEQQLFMTYQPQVDRHDSVRGVEALLRWKHPTKGLIAPEDFIPVAEQSGLIVPLGKAVIDLVCADLVTLRSQRLSLPYVSLNVSLRQLGDQAFVADVQETLARHGLTASDIEFEVTESTAMVGRVGKENAMLNKLSEQGFRIAIDDFGTGYSSLGRLLDLKVDKLKIDKVFVSAIGKPRFDAALLELMISLANRLGVKSVAEGVETLEQVVWLRQAGCQMMQGFFYAKPMTLAQLINWLKLQEGDGDFDEGVWAPTEAVEA